MFSGKSFIADGDYRGELVEITKKVFNYDVPFLPVSFFAQCFRTLAST